MRSADRKELGVTRRDGAQELGVTRRDGAQELGVRGRECVVFLFFVSFPCP